ncbi:MAG: hypothetical protein HY459_01685 [Parcubacteria group bacterium]|nr:hypothetical protein [Parcubacteria group bacterium]
MPFDISTSSLSASDLLIFVLFIVAVLLYGLSLGRKRMTIMLVALYMALAIVQGLSFLPDSFLRDRIPDERVFAVYGGIFIGAALILYVLLSRSVVRRISRDGSSGVLVTILMSLLHIGFITSVLLSLATDEFLATLSPFTEKIFVEGVARFLWLIAPIVSLVFLGGRRQREEP